MMVKPPTVPNDMVRFMADLRVAVMEYLAHRFREMNGKGESFDAIARNLGISKAQVINLKNGRLRSAGPALERAFATRFFAGSIDTLHREALAWVKDHGVAPREEVPWAFRYPNMRLALEMGKTDGMPVEYLKNFATRAHEVTGDPLPSRWWDMLRSDYLGWKHYGPGQLSEQRGEPPPRKRTVTKKRA